MKNEGDYTHTAISIHSETLNTFSWGHVRQNPSVNSSKKKPDSEEEEKEEEEEEEEGEEEKEETATLLDGNVSHENVDMDACDLSKQGLESAIAQ